MQVLAVKSDDQSQADLQTGQQIQNSVVVFIMLLNTIKDCKKILVVEQKK